MTTSNIRNPYELKTDNGVIDISKQRNLNKTIKINGHRIRISEIPITGATLSCGHTVRGIAFSLGDLVYCDKHDDKFTEASIIQVTQ